MTITDAQTEHRGNGPLPAASSSCDVLVIGGGPAGSTAAALLAEKGWSVTVLEKDRHPRFHIGESLVPMNLPILRRLGVIDEIEAQAMFKPGVEFCGRHHTGPGTTFYFDRAGDGMDSYAYQVRRSDFDEILLRNCVAQGAEVVEGVKVTSVEFGEDESSLVRTRDESGVDREWRARFLVDASGRNAFLSTRLGLKRKNPQHNSAAVFGHFENVERRTGRDEGNISLYWFDHGWIWMIPLRDGAMSVGAVCWPDYLKQRKGSVEEFLWETIQLCPGVHERMNNARLLGEATATGNYSYESERMWGPGYVLLGDAFAFLDPVFSTGVYLAMNSAEKGSAAVDACLRSGKTEEAPLAALETEVRRGLRRLSWFVYRFTTPAIHDMFLSPRNEFGMVRAVIAMLAGRVFGPRIDVLPLFMFKASYYLTVALNWSRSRALSRRRRDNLRLTVPDNTGPGRVET
ncbi:MAG: NAD(P)/FAD-dependent oxidoreductase [Kiloniellales bacterium]|nr:NAD(P)/FAD-dependent oxidoreductase [Kiloniellales bacterium]